MNNQEEDNKKKYLEQLFENSEVTGKRVEYDFSMVVRHFECSFDSNAYSSILDFDFDDLIALYEHMKKPVSKNSGEDEDFIVQHGIVGNKNFISEKLFSFVSELLLSVCKDKNPIHIGTLAKAIKVIGNDHRIYFTDEDVELYNSKKDYFKQVLSFCDFLEKRKNGTKEINKVSVMYGGVNYSMPPEWFETIFSLFEYQFNKGSKVSVDEFFQDLKKDCERFLKMYPKSKIKTSEIIQDHAIRLNSFLKTEFNISRLNKRNVIIGRIFSLLKILPAEEKFKLDKGKYISYNEYCADRARGFIRNKRKPHSINK